MLNPVFESDKFIPFSDDQLRAMKELYEGGKSAYEVADIYGIDPGAVRRRLRIMGLSLRARGRKSLFSDAECVAMLDLKAASNLTIKMLAERKGCSGRAINEALLRGRAVRGRPGAS